MKRRAALIAVAGVFTAWMMVIHAAEPKGPATVDIFANLQTEAREACEAKGHTLRVLVIVFDEAAQPVGARAGCGDPKRSKA